MKRRDFMGTGLAAPLALGLGCATAGSTGKHFQSNTSLWPICLNTSTIRPAPLKDKIRIAREAGFDGIELWINELEEHERSGGDLKDLGQEIRDNGLSIPNVIGLWESMPMEDAAFIESLVATRSRMRMAAQVGSQHVAAIPAPDREGFDLKTGARRYRELLRIGREEFNITVACEFVGFLKGVNRLGQAAAIAIDADDPGACLIADTFHLHRGGSGFEGLAHVNGAFIAVFHWNDAPASPPAGEQKDEHRVLPGDGVLPLARALEILKAIGYKGPLSLELFNRDLWKRDSLETARLGMAKMRECVAGAL